MPQFTPRRQQQILADMLAKVVARTDMSDVGDASSVKQTLSASAREDDELYYQAENLLTLFSIDSATGEDLDERAAEIQPASITRIGARKATGNSIVFSRSTTSGSVNIPAGTRIKTTDNIEFQTTALATITPASPEQIAGHGVGRDSALTPCIAIVPGTAGNVVGGSVNRFVSRPSGVDEVTNTGPIQFGVDQESDDAFRQRLKDYIAGLARSTVQALEAAVIGAEDPATGQQILFSNAVEDFVDLGNVVLFVDDGTGSIESTVPITGENMTQGLGGPPPDSAVGGETRLFLDNKPIKTNDPFALTSSTRGPLVQGVGNDYTLNPASGQINFTPALVTGEVITADYTHFSGLIQVAQLIVDGDPNDRTNFPGIRAAGVLVVVRAPTVLIQTVTATLVVSEGFVQAEVVAAVSNAVKGYINGLGISDDVIRNEIIARIQGVPGVINVSLTAPAADVPMLDDEIARTTDNNLSIS